MPRAPRALLVAWLACAHAVGCGSPACGDRVVQEGEQCDSAPAAPCQTTCGSRGIVRCDPATCVLGACEPPAESCNGADDDCDGRADEGFECTAGSTPACTTSCGSTGAARCDATCALSACEPPTEICDNGVDDDCDGVADRLAVQGAERTLTESAAIVPYARVARAAGAPVLAWTEPSEAGRRVRVSTISTAGELQALSSPLDVRGGTELALAGTSDAAFVAFPRDWPPTMFVARMAAGAIPESAAIHDASSGASGSAPALAVSERTVGIAFRILSNGIHAIHFASWGTSERPGGHTVRVSGGPLNVGPPSLAWDGAGFGVVWSDERHGPVVQEADVIVGNTELYYARLSERGELLRSEVRLTEAEGFSDGASLVWNGQAYGLTWMEERAGSRAAWLALLRPDGTHVGPARRLRGPPRPLGVALGWSGTEWGVAWLHGRSEHEEVSFMRLSPDGEPLGEIARLTSEPRRRGGLDVLWTGESWSVLWADQQAPHGALRLVRVGCE